MVGISLVASLIISLVVCIGFMTLWRRRLQRDAGTDSISSRLRTEVNELIRELNGSADRNIALLESRIDTVKSLLSRIDKLEDPPLPASPPPHAQPPSSPAASPEPEEIPESLPLREKVLALYRRGEGLDAIASRLNMSRGEVELLISLHNRRRS